MTIDTPALPSSYGWGFVVGQIIEAIADQAGDGDRFPESRPVLGSVIFEPLTPLRKISTPVALFVAHKKVVAELNDNGEIIDADGYPGVWLVTGSYRVSFKLVDAEIKAFNIEVTSAHTIGQPLNLATATPYVPEDGATVILAPATRGLIITAVGVPTIPAGTTADNLAAYYNSAAVPITVAGVDLAAGSHAVWAWVAGAWTLLSSGTSTPPVDLSDTTAPVWTATLTTGTPTDTAVVIAASALATDDVAVTGYRWRLTGEGAEVARTITPSGLNFTLNGLTASTAYAAPIFWAVDAGGNKSAELVAQGFTTAAPPPSWQTQHLATFTAPDGTALADYTPDMGGALTRSNTNAAVAIYGGATRVSYTGGNWAEQSVYWNTTNGDFNLRLSFVYDMGGAAANQMVRLGVGTAGPGAATCTIDGAKIVFAQSATGGTITETTGNEALPPLTGTAVLECTGPTPSDLTFTLRIDGTTYRQWTLSWGTNYGPPSHLSKAAFSIGGGDIYAGKINSGVAVSELRVEYLK